MKAEVKDEKTDDVKEEVKKEEEKPSVVDEVKPVEDQLLPVLPPGGADVERGRHV